MNLENKILKAVRYSLSQSGIKNFGSEFKAGYHTIILGNKEYQGQRNLAKRFLCVPYNFSDKVVVDLGCNTGGMLFTIHDKIKKGVGVDYNSKLINVANLIKDFMDYNKASFYVFNLNKEPLDILSNFVKEKEIDICFMLSMATYLDRWRDVIGWCKNNSKTLLYESHGTDEFMKEQLIFLNQKYNRVRQLTKISDTDDNSKGGKKRILYICE